jgi:hypothetical protein
MYDLRKLILYVGPTAKKLNVKWAIHQRSNRGQGTALAVLEVEAHDRLGTGGKTRWSPLPTQLRGEGANYNSACSVDEKNVR